MIDPKVFDENEECINCGGKFNLRFKLCVDCKSRDNSRPNQNINDKKHKAIEYREGDLNQKHIVVVTVHNSFFGEIKLIVPYNSQIANRVIYFVENGIRDYLENGLSQDYLINYSEFTQLKISGDDYFVFKSILN
ncbi:hypothetical protein [Flavobacterium caeni]|uniref:hypothetical protein n=1 Tax=Flavobacterium caeni TaxID=490189 RepID=UPI000B86424E|nr:hypothetical protein [Flavobacterium caeni]